MHKWFRKDRQYERQKAWRVFTKWRLIDLFRTQKNDSMLEMIRVSNLFFMVFAFVMQMTVNRLESPTPTVISQAMGLAEVVQQSSEKLS